MKMNVRCIIGKWDTLVSNPQPCIPEYRNTPISDLPPNTSQKKKKEKEKKGGLGWGFGFGVEVGSSKSRRPLLESSGDRSLSLLS